MVYRLSAFKDLENAFKGGDVLDWVEFFRQESFTPLYHDRFPQLVEELRNLLARADETAADLIATLDKVGPQW